MQQGQFNQYGQPAYGNPQQYPPAQYPQYPPQNSSAVVVVDPKYVVNYPTTLVMKERRGGFSHDDFKITDQNNNVWFQLDAKAFSFRDKRTLYDAQGLPCLTLQKKFGFGKKWSAFRGQSTDSQDCLFTVEPKIFTLTPNVKIFLKDGDRDPDFQIKGNYFGREFQILDIRGNNKTIIASCQKKFPGNIEGLISQFLFNADQYFVTLSPGVDAAFITSLCVLLDELFQDEKHD